jgi:spore coat protein U-like protein
MHLIFRLVLVLFTGLYAIPGYAACTISSGNAAFGAGSSYAVRQNGIAATSTSAGLRCNGSIITLNGGNSARATMTSANGFQLRYAGDSIAYSVSADPNGAYPFTQGSTIDYFDPQLLSLLSILNGGTFAPQIHARLTGGANVAAGTYTDTLTIQWAYTICHGVNLSGTCILSESGRGTATIQVAITVTKDCRIDAPALSFGTAAFAADFAEVTQTLHADCTKNTAFTVALSAGGNGSARPWRAMRNANGNTLRYNLFRADGSTIWDESNPLASATPGTGALSPAIPFTYRARIDPAQPTPGAGTYTDIVSVIVSF